MLGMAGPGIVESGITQPIATLAADPAPLYATFNTWMQSEQRRIFSLCYHMLQDQDEANSATQDVFLKAHRALQRGAAEPNEPARWVTRIAVNTCLDRLRKQQRQLAEQPLPADPDRVAELAGDPVPDPAEQRELRDDLTTALAELNDDQRAALVLVDIEGYSVDEAAGLLGVPPGTVKSRCARGRARLASVLRARRAGSSELEAV